MKIKLLLNWRLNHWLFISWSQIKILPSNQSSKIRSSVVEISFVDIQAYLVLWHHKVVCILSFVCLRPGWVTSWAKIPTLYIIICIIKKLTINLITSLKFSWGDSWWGQKPIISQRRQQDFQPWPPAFNSSALTTRPCYSTSWSERYT